MKIQVWVAALAFFLTDLACGGELEIDRGADENVVAQRLVGIWKLDADLAERLGNGRSEGAAIAGIGGTVGWFQFEKDGAVLDELSPAVLREFEDDHLRVFLAGRMTVKGVRGKISFLLTAQSGNPRLRLLRKLDDGSVREGAIDVLLARGREKGGDLLFVRDAAGDTPFVAFERSVREEKIWKEIEISVPGGGEANGELIIHITKNGAVTVEGKAMTQDELAALLVLLAKIDKNSGVILRADKEAAFDHVIAVLNVCQNSGIWNVGFATKGKKLEAGDLEIELPADRPGDERQELIAISIAADGGLKLDGVDKTLAELEAGLKELVKREPTPPSVTLEAHDDGKTQQFVDVINLLARLKITSITMRGFREDK